jgi:protein-L-isoaspartate(D-aspartate) O-methyltransferase
MALGAVRSYDHEPDAFDPALIPLAQFLLGLRQRGITDRALFQAFEALPRKRFMPAESRYSPLFADRPQPIDCGQTTTPPDLVARIVEALAPDERCRILDVGTGTGYLAAFLARFCRRVYTVDRFRTLVLAAQQRFEALQIPNITSSFGDGLLGWPEKSPFDRIVTTASAPSVPQSFADQLRQGGILVMPIGPADGVQMLTRFQKTDGALEATPILPVRMVPFIPGRALCL